MSDLISRSAVLDYLREQEGLVIIEKNKKGFVNADVCNGMMCSIEAFRNFVLLVPSVDAVPKEKLDEIVERLEEEAKNKRNKAYMIPNAEVSLFAQYLLGMASSLEDEAIEIVKGVMDERD